MLPMQMEKKEHAFTKPTHYPPLHKYTDTDTLKRRSKTFQRIFNCWQRSDPWQQIWKEMSGKGILKAWNISDSLIMVTIGGNDRRQCKIHEVYLADEDFNNCSAGPHGRKEKKRFQKLYIMTSLHFALIVCRHLSATKLLSYVGTYTMKGLESYLSKTAVWQECAESLSLVSNYKDLFSCNYLTD